MISLDGRIKTHPDVIFTDIDGKEAVLLHLKTKKYFSLNETGFYIWKMLSDNKTPGEIIAALENEFEVTPEKAEESVISLINELITEKLVHNE